MGPQPDEMLLQHFLECTVYEIPLGYLAIYHDDIERGKSRRIAEIVDGDIGPLLGLKHGANIILPWRDAAQGVGLASEQRRFQDIGSPVRVGRAGYVKFRHGQVRPVLDDELEEEKRTGDGKNGYNAQRACDVYATSLSFRRA